MSPTSRFGHGIRGASRRLPSSDGRPLLRLLTFAVAFVVIGCSSVLALSDDPSGQAHGSAGERELAGSESHPHYAIFFPVLAIVFGIVVYYFLTRVAHHIFPYTAAMFLLGIIMGVAVTYVPESTNQLVTSINMWALIDGHVLLMVFLPGLLFKDAFSLDIHLFKQAFGQCTLMAFPEVLAGTTLTACVLTYVFPYYIEGYENFIYSMVLGSILAATDPVAVSALLNEVGAPPRLKTHIAGESLLNDGAAIVFFNIFYNIDLFNFTGGARGQNFTWGSGIAYFLKLSLGSAALGILCGLVLVGFMWALKHRYNYEENVVQVMATVGMAYLSFYVSESVLHMSGVICVVFCGIVTKSFANSMINNQDQMQKFWDLLEHILNTVLFTLGGVVWGTVIVGKRTILWESDLSEFAGWNKITGRDWGYLFLLYFFVMAIRSFLVLVFYPMISRIGLKSNWQEAVFMSWGGLRGAVGIALGIVIENQWLNVDVTQLEGDLGGGLEELVIHQYFANLWFFFAGGISFLTLVINGSTAGPILKKLGLADTTEIREAIIDRHKQSITLKSLEHLLLLLGKKLFSDVDFAFVRFHVPFLKDITADQLTVAVRRNKAKQPAHLYSEPNLSTFAPFFSADCFSEVSELAHSKSVDRSKDITSKPSTEAKSDEEVSAEETIEMRKVFIALLQKAYEKQITKGFIDVRAGFLVYKLSSSLERMGDLVAKGDPISDWEICENLHTTVAEVAVKTARRASSVFQPQKNVQKSNPQEYKKAANDVARAVGFIAAHKLAQEDFTDEFCDGDGRMESPVERMILEESDTQIRLAEAFVKTKNPADVRSIMAHLLCQILLNEMVHTVGSYIERGLLRSTEAEHMIHRLEHQLYDLERCDGSCNEIAKEEDKEGWADDPEVPQA